MNRHRAACIALSVAVTIAFLPRSVPADSPDEAFAGDPAITIKYLPGKYYEQQAQQSVKRENFRHALEMYEKAGYWGNKIAQYNAGMLYINGAAGVPVDKVRGTAWLGIAAQTHVAYVDKALGDAYASLDADQRAAANALWKELKVDYDDKVTLDRASKKFNAQYLRDKGQINGPPEYADVTYGDFAGAGGDSTAPMVTQINGVTGRPDSHTVNAARFFAAVKDEFSDFVHVQFGAVSVGEPESISEHDQRTAPAASPHQ